jgi:hypothetical protein
MFTALILLFMFLGLIAQHFVGGVPGFGCHVLLLPLIFLCGAAALPLRNTLFLAFVGGLMWDCLTFLPVDGRAEIPFGGGILLYAGVGCLINGLRPLYLRGWWLLHAVLIGFLTTILVFVEYLAITFRREPFALIWPKEVWVRIGGSGLTAALLAIPAFLILNWIGRRLGVFTPSRADI